jgi:hypothetical protein
MFCRLRVVLYAGFNISYVTSIFSYICEYLTAECVDYYIVNRDSLITYIGRYMFKTAREIVRKMQMVQLKGRSLIANL